MKTNYIDIPGSDGALDLSTAITDGIPRYKNRILTATLELSGGTRAARTTKLQNLVSSHDGYERQIVHPDRPSHYLNGRVHVSVRFNDNAHAGVTVTVVCEPWFYANTESVRSFTASAENQTATLTNGGRKVVVPTLTVTGGPISLTYGASTVQLNAGTHKWSTLVLKTGGHLVSYKGSGTLTVKYREAVLL
jgi:hypothetical protein